MTHLGAFIEGVILKLSWDIISLRNRKYGMKEKVKYVTFKFPYNCDTLCIL